MALVLTKVPEAALRAVKLRDSDYREIEATSSLDPREALLVSTKVSDWWWAVCDEEDESIVAVFGVAPDRLGGSLPGIGCPWFLATDALYSHKNAISRLAIHWLDEMHKTYPVLHQFVDARHKAAIRWVLKLGFDVVQTTTQGRNGELLVHVAHTKSTHKGGAHVRPNFTGDDAGDAVGALSGE